MAQNDYVIKEIPINQLVCDEDRPNHYIERDEEIEPLLDSIEKLGMASFIIVTEIGKDRYLIIDGYRRFRCARKLGYKTVACSVHGEMTPGEIEALRFMLHETVLPWRKAERLAVEKKLKKLGFPVDPSC